MTQAPRPHLTHYEGGGPNLPPVGWGTNPGLGSAPHLPPIGAESLSRNLDLRHPQLEDPALSARFGATERANRCTLEPRKLLKVEVTRPTVLVPLSVVSDLIYYQAKTAPSWVAGTTPGSSGHEAPLKSTGAGICFLHTKGDWYLWANQASGNVEAALVPAEDGIVGARYLAEGGVVRIGPTPASPVVGTGSNTSTGSVMTLAANRDRRFLMIQNTGGTGTALRIGIGTTPTAGVPPAGTGLCLTAQGTLIMSGDSCWRGEVNVIAPAGQLFDVLELV